MVDQGAKEDAAAECVDSERLLHGEDPGTPYHDDASHWLRVYAELLGVKRELLRVVEDRLGNLQPETRREVAGTDLVVLDAEMKRFSRRHQYWRDRCEQLAEDRAPA